MDEKLCYDTINGLFCNRVETEIILGHDTFDRFIYSYEAIRNHIELLGKDEELSEIDIDKVRGTLENLLNLILYEEIDQVFCDFSNAWIYLVHNWNLNTFKDSKIKHNVALITRLLQGYLATKDAIDILKNLSKRLREFRHWNPPSIDIAKHYLQYLEDDDEIMKDVDNPDHVLTKIKTGK